MGSMEDSLSSQKKDLIKFIDREIKNIENISVFNSVKNGLNMIYYIFWTLYVYTYNVKLTMFLTERAVLLFTEFIVMSRNPILNKEFRFIPNINDAITFALKKTIGPIKLSTL